MSEQPEDQNLKVIGVEELSLGPLADPPKERPLDHKREDNSMIVTVVYIGGILALLASSVTIASLMPFWVLEQVQSAIPDGRLTILVELVKSSSTILSSLVSGLLTALGIGIGYFFRRHGSGNE